MHNFSIISAIRPENSAVVEACAGSGKTWLLVSRMIRLLLSGVPPAEMFAITFTRKAAEEMRGRLFEWLELLATSPDEVALAFLAEVAWNRPPPSLPCRAPGDCSRRYCIPPLAP